MSFCGLDSFRRLVYIHRDSETNLMNIGELDTNRRTIVNTNNRYMNVREACWLLNACLKCV